LYAVLGCIRSLEPAQLGNTVSFHNYKTISQALSGYQVLHFRRSKVGLLQSAWPKCHLLCCAALCCAALRCAALRCAVLRCAALCCAALRCAALCCAVLCCAVLCCAVSCHAMRCLAMSLAKALLSCIMLMQVLSQLPLPAHNWASVKYGGVWCRQCLECPD